MRTTNAPARHALPPPPRPGRRRARLLTVLAVLVPVSLGLAAAEAPVGALAQPGTDLTAMQAAGGHHHHYRDWRRLHPTPTSTPTRSATPTPTRTPTPTPTRPTRPPSAPTPTPTVTAPVTPPPASGGYGVPAGTALRASGNLTVSTSGAVVDGLDVSGCIVINAPNVTIRNTRVRGTCDLLVANNGGGLVLDHVELDGRGSSGTLGIGYDRFTVRNSYIHGVGDGIRANGNVTVESSWITDLAAGGGSHNDGIQVTAGSNIRIVGNRIENSHTQTSAILIGADQGSVSNVLVQGNTLAGGGYTLYGGARPPAGNSIANIVLKDNAFSRKYFASSGAYGPMTATDDSRISVSGNVWEGTTTLVS